MLTTYCKSKIFREGIFRENKPLAKWRNHNAVNDVGQSCSSHEYLISQICIFMLFTKVKFSQKILNLQYMKNYFSVHASGLIFSFDIQSDIYFVYVSKITVARLRVCLGLSLGAVNETYHNLIVCITCMFGMKQSVVFFSQNVYASFSSSVHEVFRESLCHHLVSFVRNVLLLF